MSSISKKLTTSTLLLWRNLASRRAWFMRNKRLAIDGSFYCWDERLAQDNRVSVRTIRRSIRQLIEEGKIRVARGRFKGNCTKYWILELPDKMSAFNNKLMPDNMSVKPVNSSSKEGQIVPPNNKNNNKKDEAMTDEEIQKMHDVFQIFLSKKNAGISGNSEKNSERAAKGP